MTTIFVKKSDFHKIMIDFTKISFYTLKVIIILIIIKNYHPERGDRMEQKLKKSRQRDAIIAFLMTRKDHPTADIIYENVRKEIPNISLGTVYRNLALLTERGEILKLSFDSASDRYDATTTPHYHFRCRTCGSVCDLEIEEDFNEILDRAGQNFNGRIEGQTIFFFGTCPNCLNLTE